jgi:glucan 1,3-beta-glucosidase
MCVRLRTFIQYRAPKFHRPETETSYNGDMNALEQYATKYSEQVYGISVGSDTLFRKDFTGPQLAKRMQRVKSSLNGQFKVGIADSWSKFIDGAADAVIKEKPDFL